MTDTDKINGPAQKVDVPVSPVTDVPRDVDKSTEEQNRDTARQAFDATRKPVVEDASLSAADGSTSSVAGS